MRKWYEKEIKRSLDLVDRMVREEVKLWLREKVSGICKGSQAHM